MARDRAYAIRCGDRYVTNAGPDIVLGARPTYFNHQPSVGGFSVLAQMFAVAARAVINPHQRGQLLLSDADSADCRIVFSTACEHGIFDDEHALVAADPFHRAIQAQMAAFASYLQSP